MGKRGQAIRRWVVVEGPQLLDCGHTKFILLQKLEEERNRVVPDQRLTRGMLGFLRWKNPYDSRSPNLCPPLVCLSIYKVLQTSADQVQMTYFWSILRSVYAAKVGFTECVPRIQGVSRDFALLERRGGGGDKQLVLS